MYGFQFKDVTYGQEAAGWVDGVYYPRTPRINDGSSFLEEEQDGRGARVHEIVHTLGRSVLCASRLFPEGSLDAFLHSHHFQCGLFGCLSIGHIFGKNLHYHA